jgi:hypothetical protein
MIPDSFLQAAVLPAVAVITLTSVGIVLIDSWRLNLLALGLQYLGVFFLAALSWTPEMAAVKLVAGWMAAAVLGIAISESQNESSRPWEVAESAWPSSRIFRLMASILVVMAAFSLSANVSGWIPLIPDAQAQGGMLLMGMGLLQLGLTAQPVRTAVGLLTVISGFEIIYSAAEASALLAGLLALVHLGLALACAYLVLAPAAEESE